MISFYLRPRLPVSSGWHGLRLRPGPKLPLLSLRLRGSSFRPLLQLAGWLPDGRFLPERSFVLSGLIQPFWLLLLPLRAGRFRGQLAQRLPNGLLLHRLVCLLRPGLLPVRHQTWLLLYSLRFVRQRLSFRHRPSWFPYRNLVLRYGFLFQYLLFLYWYSYLLRLWLPATLSRHWQRQPGQYVLYRHWQLIFPVVSLSLQ